jgi:ferric-dicitrate binding protein FerR (iron transport regulator)
MATLEKISDATVKSVARASSEAAAMAPVRTELKAVRDELWEHDEALARLARSIENLRRKAPAAAPAPPAKKAPAAAKRAPGAKAVPAKPAARTPKKS